MTKNQNQNQNQNINKLKRQISKEQHPEWFQTTLDNLRKENLYNHLEEQLKIKDSYKFSQKYQTDCQLFETFPSYRYDTYKKYAETRNLGFQLSIDKATEIFLDQCFYCGHVGTLECLNGIDLMLNDVGYEETNCVSCCKTCNNIKYMLDPCNFIYIVRHILNNLQAIKTNESYPQFFENFSSVSYDAYKKRSHLKMVEFELTDDDFKQLTKRPCYMCGKSINNSLSPEHSNGIDRFDNSVGYTLKNTEPCCKTCSYMKKELSHENFIDKLVDIYYNNLLFDSSTLPDVEHNNILPPDIKGHDMEDKYFDFDINFDILNTVLKSSQQTVNVNSKSAIGYKVELKPRQKRKKINPSQDLEDTTLIECKTYRHFKTIKHFIDDTGVIWASCDDCRQKRRLNRRLKQVEQVEPKPQPRRKIQMFINSVPETKIDSVPETKIDSVPETKIDSIQKFKINLVPGIKINYSTHQ